MTFSSTFTTSKSPCWDRSSAQIYLNLRINSSESYSDIVAMIAAASGVDPECVLGGTRRLTADNSTIGDVAVDSDTSASASSDVSPSSSSVSGIVVAVVFMDKFALAHGSVPEVLERLEVALGPTLEGTWWTALPSNAEPTPSRSDLLLQRLAHQATEVDAPSSGSTGAVGDMMVIVASSLGGLWIVVFLCVGLGTTMLCLRQQCGWQSGCDVEETEVGGSVVQPGEEYSLDEEDCRPRRRGSQSRSRSEERGSRSRSCSEERGSRSRSRSEESPQERWAQALQSPRSDSDWVSI